MYWVLGSKCHHDNKWSDFSAEDSVPVLVSQGTYCIVPQGSLIIRIEVSTRSRYW